MGTDKLQRRKCDVKMSVNIIEGKTEWQISPSLSFLSISDADNHTKSHLLRGEDCFGAEINRNTYCRNAASVWKS